MRVCRTLDYIVETDLHLYLFVKFDSAMKKGIQVEIDLTEPITYLPVDSERYIEIVDMILDSAINSLTGHEDKKLNFYMFYTEIELHLVLQYSSIKERSCKTLDVALRRSKSFSFFSTNKKGVTTQHLIVTP